MLVQLILSDLYRYCGNTKFSSFIKNYFFNRGFNFSFWLRLAGSQSIIAKFAYPIFYYKKKKYGIDIHCSTKIGYGLYIGHGGSLVVNPTTIIANNVNLSQYMTIGAGSVVTKDIPENATAVGNYAKVINYNKAGKSVNRRWSIGN